MKKLRVLSLLSVLFVTFALVTSCSLFAPEVVDEDLEGTVWKFTSMTDGLTGETMAFPRVETQDIDADGTAETVTFNMYVLLKDGLLTMGTDIDISDGGSTTGPFGTGGLSKGQSGPYTKSGNTITSEGEPATFKISEDVLTISATSVDEDDDDEDGNFTEEYTTTTKFKAVSSPTPAQLLAAPLEDDM